MNRGHYARVRTMDELHARFLDIYQGEAVQVLSLGAGFDSRFWRFRVWPTVVFLPWPLPWLLPW